MRFTRREVENILIADVADMSALRMECSECNHCFGDCICNVYEDRCNLEDDIAELENLLFKNPEQQVFQW